MLAFGLESGMNQARTAAAGSPSPSNGAGTVQQLLNAGLLDEISIDIAAVLLGSAVRLFGDLALPPHLAQMTKRYIVGLPGHPDSGKPINRNFATVGEMRAYAKERRDAALAYIKVKKGQK